MEANSKLSPDDKEASEMLVDQSNAKIDILLQEGPQNNGDTVISIAEVSQAFVGMGKEELMKFANDPFWVKLRWFLFALFWLMWLGMLAGAVAIIFFAPKCSPPVQEPLGDQALYQVDLGDYYDQKENPIKAFENKVHYLEELGVTSVLFNSLMKSSEEGLDHVVDFKQLHPELGTLDQLKNLLTMLKEKGMHTFLKVVPNFSSIQHEWFNKSVSNIPPFNDYYVWKEGKTSDDPPNNWLSVTGGKAWTWNNERQLFYLHQFKETQPDLNFRNKDVVNYFKDVFKNWLDVGFDGIHVDKVEYLFEDEQLEDEYIDHTVQNKIHDDYLFWTHLKTTYLDESIECLKEWSETIRNASGLVSATGVMENNDANVDLAYLPFTGSSEPVEIIQHLQNYINHNLERQNKTWLWEIDGLGEEEAFAMDALMLLLPGSTMLNNGRELNLKNLTSLSVNEEASSAEHNETVMKVDLLEYYKEMIKVKKSLTPTVYKTKLGYTENLLLLARLNEKSEGYVFLSDIGEGEGVTLSANYPNVNNFVPILYSTYFKRNNPDLFPDKKNGSVTHVSMSPYSYVLFKCN